MLSLEPIYAPPVTAPPSKRAAARPYSPDPPIEEQLELVPEETSPRDDGNAYLPNIYELMDIAGRNKKSTSLTRRKEVKTENLLIYKDFETGLTKVKTPITRFPGIG